MKIKKWPNKTLFKRGLDDHGQDLGYFRHKKSYKAWGR